MKKNLCFLLLLCLVLPVCAFFGCGAVNYYTFSYFVSDVNSGSCEGGGFSANTCSGTFAEGSTVTLTATPFEGEQFLGWVYRETNLIVDGQDGYSVTKTAQGGSILKFASSQSRAGEYTAVFSSTDQTTSNKLVDYVQFDSFMFEKLDGDGNVDQNAQFSFSVKELDVSQGAELAREYVFDFLQEELEVTQNNSYKVSDYLTVNKVLHLTSISDQRRDAKRVNAFLRIGDSFAVNNVTVKVFLRDKQEDERVTYKDGVYEIRFGFEYGGENYNLVLIYKILDIKQSVEDVQENPNENFQDVQENL